MSIYPYRGRSSSPEGESRRARLALAIAAIGIAATLLAYAASPGVRHVVGHAERSVKHAVGHAVDHVFSHHAKSSHSKQPGSGR